MLQSEVCAKNFPGSVLKKCFHPFRDVVSSVIKYLEPELMIFSLLEQKKIILKKKDCRTQGLTFLCFVKGLNAFDN